MKLLFIATTPFAVNAFLRTHMLTLAKEHEVTLCVNTRLYPLDQDIRESVNVIHVDIVRRVAPLQDLGALFQLMNYFMQIRPSVVHSLTPKAGLLAMLAGFLTRVPYRVHSFTGQVWTTRRGLERWALKNIDRLIVFCATRVFADSVSQCFFLDRERVVRKRDISVLGDGSIAGVDLARFQPNSSARSELRSALGVVEDIPVFLFVGRLVSDKGIRDLLDAFTYISAKSLCSELWIVGPDEEKMRAEYQRQTEKDGLSVRWFGPTEAPEAYMVAADVFVLPSYREGFGSTVIEAAACGIPTIAYRIDGIIDAVLERQTGLLVEKSDLTALAVAMSELATDNSLRRSLGEAALARARTYFSNIRVTQAWVGFYNSMHDVSDALRDKKVR